MHWFRWRRCAQMDAPSRTCRCSRCSYAGRCSCPRSPCSCSRSARGYAGRCSRPRSTCSCSRSARGHPQVCPYLPGPGPAYIAQRVLTESLCGVCPSPRRGCAGRGGRCGCGNARGHAGNARGHVAALPAGGPTCLESLSPAGGLGGLAEASHVRVASHVANPPPPCTLTCWQMLAHPHSLQYRSHSGHGYANMMRLFILLVQNQTAGRCPCPWESLLSRTGHTLVPHALIYHPIQLQNNCSRATREIFT